MGILARSRVRYVREWLDCMKAIGNRLGRVKIVTNAGGLDPVAFKKALEHIAQENGWSWTIACVYGDDVLENLDSLPIQPFQHVDADQAQSVPKDKMILSCNAYHGAYGILNALDSGAQIVICGRVADSALVLGPLLHHYRWHTEPNPWDKLAMGCLAGHVIECGAQATGGNFTDWRQSSKLGGWANIGFPIVHVHPSAEFIVTKPEETGGCVNIGTVSEQILYETLDPEKYLLPDCILDLRHVHLQDLGADRILVTNGRGMPPPNTLKLSGVYVDGWKIVGELVITGFDAREKAVAVAQAIRNKSSNIMQSRNFKPFNDFCIECLGSEALFG